MFRKPEIENFQGEMLRLLARM